MNPVELLVAKPAGHGERIEPAGVFFCSKCRRVWPNEHDAGQCCLCSYCGKELPKGENYHHYECMMSAYRKRHEAQLASARVVTDHEGFVFCEQGGPNDGYAQDIDEMAEWWQDEIDSGDRGRDEYPEFVLACMVRPPRQVDADDLVEMLAEEGYEDMHDDVVVPDSLKDALKEFNDANKNLVTYEPDYKRKVKMPELVRSSC